MHSRLTSPWLLFGISPGIFILSSAITTEALAEEPPKLIQQMISRALDLDDPKTVKAIVLIAKKTVPDSAGEIDAMVADYKTKVAARDAEKKRQQLRQVADSNMFQYWKGSVELGGAKMTGNTRQSAIYGAISLDRNGINWSHSIKTRADFQSTYGVTSTERFTASYQPHYKFDERLYVYGLALFERDMFLGYRTRITGGSGVGYKVFDQPNLALAVEGGPAFRHTVFIDDNEASGHRIKDTAAMRGSFTTKWKLSPLVTLSEDSSIFFESSDITASSTTALETKLIGNLSTKISFSVYYEKDVSSGTKPMDTTSRITFAYSLGKKK
ncbi:MAG: DUF481 domain-containing protein [Zymomonas mobilis subsp. pomaceae]|uniref:DUF481 domain-containing protein n=1 Tax=Zymomonas mobilis TaxID=542 RepID=UPI0039EA2F36